MRPQETIKKARNFRSLTVTLTLAILGVSISVLLLGGSIDIYYSIQSDQKAIENQQNMIAKNAAKEVEGFFQEKFSIMETAIGTGDIISLTNEKQSLLMNKLLGIEQSFRYLKLTDKNGNELSSVSRVSNTVSEQILNENITEIIDQVSKGNDYISNVYIDDSTNEPIVIMAIPVNDILRDFSGVLIADVNLKFMWDLVGNLEVGKEGVAYVVDRDGYLISFGDVSRVLKRENLMHIQEVREFSESGINYHATSASISEGIFGNAVVSNHEHLMYPDWAVIVEVPVSEAYESIITKIEVIATAILFSIILAILTAIFVSRMITRPLINLSNAAKEIGEGKLDTKIEIKTRDEIGQLASTFNQMTRDLRSSRDKLKDYSNNLEKKVKERTNDLNIKVSQLEASEKRFQDIAMSSADFIWEVDEKGRYKFVSETVKNILGYKPKEMTGKTPFDFMPKSESKRIGKKFSEIIAAKKRIENMENWNLKKNGKKVLLQTSGVPIIGPNGKLLGYRGVDKDITMITNAKNKIDQKVNDLQDRDKKITKMNKRLKELDKEKDEFISIAAHELKTPLTSIKGFTQLLQDKKVMNNKKMRSHYLDLVNQNTNRLYDLILDVVDSSRISLRKLNIDIKDIDPQEILDDLKENMKFTIKDKGIKAEFRIEKGLPKILADKERLLQVIRNLIVNAVHFTHEGGSITIDVSRKGKFVQFYVKDTGEGIPKDKQSGIFSRFYQADASLTRKVTGSGLGLSICKGLIEIMGGKIWFESTEGKGTTFFFTVPIESK